MVDRFSVSISSAAARDAFSASARFRRALTPSISPAA
jgi:hypothetical protein